MKIINLTPHSVTVGDFTFPPSGKIARCEETWEAVTSVDGVPLICGFKYGKTDVPSDDGETFYIVSLPVALAEPNRDDLLISVGQVRDETGKIIGATGLGRI